MKDSAALLDQIVEEQRKWDSNHRKSKSGDCEDCGRWDSRLHGGICGACRNKYKDSDENSGT